MADAEVKAAASDSTSGKMIFEPILEDGIFRFDCSENARDAAYPSLSFINSKDRDVRINSNKVPLYVPSFECLSGQQIVKIEIDLRIECRIQFIASSSFPVITFGPFPSPSAVLISLSHTTGTIFMPPKWSLGYHQCRWSYESEERVLQIARQFREKDIPCDVIWMDIDYMDGFRCFTFDKAYPKSLVKSLHHIGFKAIWMLDPGIKHEDGYFVYDSGSEHDAWIEKADGTCFVGDVWPGPCVFPDFTQSKIRSWWANLVKDFISNGVDGIWNDMNEPAIFKVVTKTMPESNIHRGDNELGGCQSHAYYHNLK
ncbi:Glycoside hydrolase, family 31 [Corchorus olitorius]|uniref:Glycoside hydrolase, family 31 n=1 Tax=Corchorus olitorius TaxID=93759 RepID=A0A1R3KNZ6_9ROSI|nr:Glycoside hydrolase, family 31 [Corchorus olitorius]